MKRLFAIPLLLACFCAAQAAILKVASNGTQAYTDIADATAASSAGDTVLVMAGGYSGFTVPHRLVIIGSGTGLGIGEGSLVNGIVSVEGAADSTELRSLWIVSSPASGSIDSVATVVRIQAGAEQVFIWRCIIENISLASGSGIVWLGENTNTEISQCVLWSSQDPDATGQKGVLQRGSSNLRLVSTAIINIEDPIGKYGTNNGANVTASHCLFTAQASNIYPCQTNGTGIIENSVFFINSGVLSYTGGTAVVYNYCGYTSGEASPPGATHTACDSLDFVNLNLIDFRSGDYHVSVASDLEDAGNPGSPFDLNGSQADIGIYGGQHPYVDGGVPDYPFAVQVEVPYSAPLNGTMRIWGRGRVGPGN